MDDQKPPKPSRKFKFAPKPPSKRESKLVLPKVEKEEIGLDDAKAEHLLRRLNETSFGKPKVERKVEPVEVAFGSGGPTSSVRSYAAHKTRNGLSSNGDEKMKKEYKEPWDYSSYYPVTLPLRKPYAGNAELLDEEEFGEDSRREVYDEDNINTAEELGLLEEDMENKMMFLQLPKVLPAIKQTKEGNDSQKASKLESLPAGLMGKMLVYKSGKVKLKLGDTIYDVSPGVGCSFPQDAVAVNANVKKHCVNLGEINKLAVVTPDIDFLL